MLNIACGSIFFFFDEVGLVILGYFLELMNPSVG